MARQPKCRHVEFIPAVTSFKPAGIPRMCMEEVILLVEEVEAIRLKDYLGMEQEECAQNMKVSRPTFQRILMEGRSKIADALINGKSIRIEGGDYCLGATRCRRRERMEERMKGCPYAGRAIRPVQNGNEQLRRSDELGKTIAICSSGDSMDSLVDGRFGRCAYFIIWDEEKKEAKVLNNQSLDANQGAGTGLAQQIINQGVGALICNRIGPKAFAVLNQVGIKIFSGSEGITVEATLEKYRAAELSQLESANN
jgi:predicted DNA-binding protein (UPF0251 family)/predicted Fe-Mo cluster-binding NifX family protein